jgi:flagellar biogenesis protein FliO
MSIPHNRRGVALLALAGVLYVACTLIRGPMIDPVHDPVRWTHAAFSQAGRLSWAVVLGAGSLEVLGLAALYALLARYGDSAAARWGWALSTVGMALALPLFGFMALVAPKLGQMYAQGDTRVMEIVTTFFGGSRLSVAFMAVSTLAYLVGCLLTSIVLWTRTDAPKWAAIAFFLHAPLITLPIAFAASVAGAVLLLASAVAFLRMEGPAAAPSAPSARPAAEPVGAGV